MRLTDHFTLEELTDSDTAVRLGIDNTPPAAMRPHLEVLARGLEEIRRILGQPIIVKSGYRCEALEKVLCAKDYASWCKRHGKPQATAWPEYFARKAHPLGYAADFICPRFGTPVEIVRALKNAGVKFDQVIEEGSWVHASFDYWRERLLRADDSVGNQREGRRGQSPVRPRLSQLNLGT